MLRHSAEAVNAEAEWQLHLATTASHALTPLELQVCADERWRVRIGLVQWVDCGITQRSQWISPGLRYSHMTINVFALHTRLMS